MVEVNSMDYVKIQREIVNRIPDDIIFSRKDLSNIADKISTDFKYRLYFGR
jgi:hypothetical protein